MNVSGSVITNANDCGGLVGYVLPDAGASAIVNCRVSEYVGSRSRCGGIVGNAKSSELSVTDCVFSGRTSALLSAGIVGGCDGGASLALKNCLSTGEGNYLYFGLIAKSDSAKGGSCSVQNCYYTTTKTRSDFGTQVTDEKPEDGIYRAHTALDGNTYYDTCSIQDLKPQYDYTGSPVQVGFVVRNGSGGVVPRRTTPLRCAT